MQTDGIASVVLSYLVEEMGGVIDIKIDRITAHMENLSKGLEMSVLGDKIRIENVEEE